MQAEKNRKELSPEEWLDEKFETVRAIKEDVEKLSGKLAQFRARLEELAKGVPA